jgi:antitoxin ParD1/3/4
MEIALTPDLEELVDEQVTKGNYPSAGEVIRDALRLFRDQLELSDKKLAALRTDVQVGIDALEGGDYTEYDVDDIRQLAEEVKARGRQRLKERGRASG